jgi:dipeptidase, putative
MIDFKKAVLEIKDEMLMDIKKLCQIDSVLDESTIKAGQPFGLGNRKALDCMLEIGIRDGFIVKDVDGYAGHIDIGKKVETVGVLGHLDVVPTNINGWDYEPFNMTIKDGYLYGRGVADDKGPLIAAYYASKIVNAMDIPKKRGIRIIFGCNEESGSNCMKYYFKHEKFPTLGFTPDAGFPVCYGEKALASFVITGEKSESKLISFKAGSVANIVPEVAEAIVVGSVLDYQASFNAFLNSKGVKGEIEALDAMVKFTLIGKSAHASVPDLGVNSAVLLASYLNSQIDDITLNFVDRYFMDDNHAEKLGFYLKGEMGEVTVNLGVMQIGSTGIKIVLDSRCPHELKEEVIIDCMNKVIGNFPFNFTYNMLPHLYVDPNSELVQKLHGAYAEISGDKESKPVTMGGGTYAKEMPNCVAFGIELPNTDNRIHQNNERMAIDDLILGTIIYAKALYELVKE